MPAHYDSTVSLVQEPVANQSGLSFYFTVNEVPIFIKVCIPTASTRLTVLTWRRGPTGCRQTRGSSASHRECMHKRP